MSDFVRSTIGLQPEITPSSLAKRKMPGAETPFSETGKPNPPL